MSSQQVIRTMKAMVGVGTIIFGVFVHNGALQAAQQIDVSNSVFNFAVANRTNVVGTDGDQQGEIVKYSNVITVDGVSVDAVVETIALTNVQNSQISRMDTSSNYGEGTCNVTRATNVNCARNFGVDVTTTGVGGGSAEFRFSFFEAGTYTTPNTGVPIILRNVRITSLDLDATNTSEFQYTEFSGFESYILNNPSNLAVISTNAPLIRFVQTINGRRENVAQDQVQVEYNSISTFSVKIGNVEAGLAYFGVLFEQVTFPNGANLSTVSNPGNVPPTSANDTKFVTSGVPMTLNADLNAGASSSAITDFGDYQDADGQSLDTIKIVTLPATGNLEYWNGTAWIAVVQNQSIPGTDLAAGNLRYTAGGVDSSFDFIVNDGIVDSLTTYTLTLRVAQQAQIIEVTPHATPGTSVTPIVTATSGNTPILSSQTLGACTVSGGVISVVGGVTTGVCVIQISEPGDSTFAEAPVTELRINISGGNLSTIPTVITNAPTNVQDGSAQLEGSVNPNGLTTTVTFVYGTSPLLSSGNTSVTATQSPLTAGTANVAVSNSVTGLPVGTYFYRTIATSSGGVVQGVIRSFVVTASSNSVAATTTVAPSTTTAVSVTTVVVPTSPAELSGPTRSTLPRTGNSRNDLLLLAGVLYVMGSALLVMSRRRRINGSY